MKVTLWFKYDKHSDSYKYNHLDFNGWNEDRKPKNNDKTVEKSFNNSKWLKDFVYLRNREVVYIV